MGTRERCRVDLGRPLDLFAVRLRHPHYADGQFFARPQQLRRPWDWPAEVQPLWSGSLTTSEPATDFDHEKLTYRHAGRDYRLTDVYGRVVKEIIRS